MRNLPVFEEYQIFFAIGLMGMIPPNGELINPFDSPG
jgi:hypothetical protein